MDLFGDEDLHNLAGSSRLSIAHDVLLSFTGTESGKIIVDPLCAALNLEGIHVNLSNDGLEGREGMYSESLSAIERSMVTIVVLSESYASTETCLDELVQILESNKTEEQRVIPVFYHVDSADVIHQTGGFGTPWNIALQTIGRLAGYHLPNSHTQHEKETGGLGMRKKHAWTIALRKIGRLAGYHLPKSQTQLDPELISKIVEKVKLEISNSENQADEMKYQLHFPERDYTLSNVKGLLYDLHQLREDLTYRVLIYKHVAVRNLRVMVINKISDLSEIPNNITFPDLKKLVLHSETEFSSIPSSFFERMPILKELDLSFSEIRSLPPFVFKLIELETLILKGCEDLIEIPHEISALKNLKALDLTRCKSLVQLPGSIYFPRSLSVLTLNHCESLTELPSGIGKLGSLKTIHLYGCSSLFKFPFAELSTRILSWDIQAEQMDILIDSHGGFSELVGRLKRVLEFNIFETKFVAVRNLKVVHICNSKIPEIPDSIRFPDLEKLILQPNPNLSNIPSSLFENMPALELLDISKTSVKYLPHSVVKLGKLKRLFLEGCESLMEIPHDIGVLDALRELDLSGCKVLDKLPESINKLRSIHNLNLSGCESLMEIPHDIGVLDALWELNLSGCKVLDKLPESINNLRCLYNLNLSGCESLMEIPHDIGVLDELRKLDLSGCKVLDKLPESINKLRFINNLNLSGCENFAEFPESLTFPPNLYTLNLTDCKGLTKLPESIGELEFLRRLILSGCENLAEIPKSIKNLKNLNKLVLTNCRSLTKLPECTSKLENLKQLELSGCSNIFQFRGPQVSVKCITRSFGNRNRKEVQLDFHEKQGTPADFTEILGLMEKVLQHPLLKLEGLEVEVTKLEVIHMSNSKLPEIPKNLCFPNLQKLVLQPNFDFSHISSSFFDPFLPFKVLDMSHSSVKTLPPCVCKLTRLRELILQHCNLLIELPDGIGAMVNLELLDLEGTDLVCLPEELGKLIYLTCLKFSLYDAESYRKSKKIVDIVPTAVLSKLTKLEELSINVNPQNVWCSASVKAIIEHLPSLTKLKTLKLYLPTTELLQNLVERRSNRDDLSIYQNLSNFSIIIGPHPQRFISRLPRDLEEEFLKLNKCLKYINGKDTTTQFAEALKHANSLYLDRHWTIEKLSVFKLEELNKLKFCLLVDCNVMQTVFDGSDFNLGADFKKDNHFSLQYLAIHYLKNLESIWKGPGVGCCLSSLKVLVLNMCPNLTTIFTPVLLQDLVNLKEIIVEDCPKLTSLIAEESTQLTAGKYFPRLKKLSLLFLPELESIFNGISIGPELEHIVIYDCPKLKRLLSLGVRNKEVIKIKGESEWWNDLGWNEPEWSGDQPQYLHYAFSEVDIDGDFLVELATQYVNSLRLFVKESDAY